MTEGKVIRIFPKRCKEGKLQHGPFTVDPEVKDVQCDGCGQTMNPMAVLMILSEQDSALQKRIENLRKVVSNYSNLRCPHCAGHIMIKGAGE